MQLESKETLKNRQIQHKGPAPCDLQITEVNWNLYKIYFSQLLQCLHCITKGWDWNLSPFAQQLCSKYIWILSSNPQRMRKGNVITWWFVLQGIGDFTFFHLLFGRNIAAFLILFRGIIRIGLQVIVEKELRKLAAASMGFVFQETQKVHSTLQAVGPTAPNNSLTVHRAMPWPEPVVSGWSQLYLADLKWSTVALRHNSGLRRWGPIERCLYTATWPRARTPWPVTHCQQGLNLKVGKKRPHFGTPDPIWAKYSKRGQNLSGSGKKKFYSYPLCYLPTIHNSRSVPNFKFSVLSSSCSMSIEQKLCEEKLDLFQLQSMSNQITCIDKSFAVKNSGISWMPLIFNLSNPRTTILHAKISSRSLYVMGGVLFFSVELYKLMA